MADDPVLQALEELHEALTRNVEVGALVLERIERMREAREGGSSWSDLVASEEGPLIVQLLSDNIGRLSASGSRLRRAQAKALYEEGMTMERIATAFGVTRQRVSALLKERPSEVNDR